MPFDNNWTACSACGESMHMESFDDESFYLDGTVDGWCRRCRGLSELGHDPDEGSIRNGALIAHTVYIGPAKEICILPFQIPAPGAAVQWDTRHIIRIGSNLLPIKPQFELAPLKLSFENHPVRIEEFRSPKDPQIRERLRAMDLVIGVEQTSKAVIRKLPCPDETHVAILTTDVPWRELYGCDLAPLDNWCPDPAGVQSTLRLAALMGFALDFGLIQPKRSQRPFKHLVSRLHASNSQVRKRTARPN